MNIHTKNLLVISSPLSSAFQMFSYFVLAKNAENCPENNSISRKSSNTEFTVFSIYCISNVWQLVQAMDSSMFCLYVYFCTADYRRLLLIDFPIPAELQKECVLEGHGNEADFLGFLQKLVPHESLTLPFGPFRFWLRICGDIHI
jgi:hypothetical protein